MNFIELLKINFQTVLSKGALGISFNNLIIIIFLFFIALLVRKIFAKFILNKLRRIITKTTTQIDDRLLDSLMAPLMFFPIIIVFLIATLYIDLNTSLGFLFQKINNTLLTAFIFWFLHQSLNPFSIFLIKLETLLSKAIVNWLLKTLKYLIVFLGIVAVLEIWGIKIGPIIAGLGLFGVAVALGAQDLFKNLISGIMIIMEKRFNIGDVIKVPGHTEGVVEQIGFRSTLIRKFDSTPITIPNYIFAEAPILNYTNRNYRRINWTIGLEYSSTLDQIKKLTEMISSYLKDNDNFIVDDNYKSFVRIDKFNDSSIDILVICFTSTKDWDKYLEIKEELAMKIKDSVEKIGLNFAFPSQSIYIEKSQDS